MISRTLYKQSSSLFRKVASSALRSSRCSSALLTNLRFLRSYSLSAGQQPGSHTDPVQFLNKQVKGKEVNRELLSARIYKDARLPMDQDEYEIYEDINDVVQTRILPNIQEDGGNMEFRGFNFDDGTVFVKLTGACTSCSMSETTLKHGIESMLTYYVPEVTGVKQVFDPEEEIAFSEFEKFERSLKNKQS